MRWPDEIVLFAAGSTRISAIPYRLNFKTPFKLAMGLRTHTSLVLLQVEHQNVTAFGEASLPPYLKETEESVLKFFKHFPWDKLMLDGFSAVIEELEDPVNSAACAAISIAWNDLMAQQAAIPLWQHLGLEEPVGKTTVFTIGISKDSELEQKIKESRDFPMIKLKLGEETDLEMIKDFRKRSSKSFCADVNQGWKDRDFAARVCEELFNLQCEFLEQPFPVGFENDAYWLRQRVALPIVGDESLRNRKDFRDYEDCFDGMNVKLMKCGGLHAAIDLLKLIEKNDKIPILGAMAESSCAVTAAAHLASLAKWVDLDGPLLSANDPFEGIKYQQGVIIIPNRVGSGLRLIAI